MPFYVGIDIGGTTSTVAIGAHNRRLVTLSDQFPTRSQVGPEAVITDLVNQLEELLRPLAATFDDVVTIGLASPGPATFDGVLMPSPNLAAPQWRNFPLRRGLEERIQARAHATKVTYIGDGQAAALGEFAVRTGRLHVRVGDSPHLTDLPAEPASLDSLFFLAVGTGLGGGEVRDGRVVRGANGRAGHAGHLLLPEHAFRYEHDRRFQVGNTVSAAESAVSLSALAYQLDYRLSLPEWKSHPLNDSDDSAKEKAKRLRELAAAEDPLALELLDDQARALGMVLLMVNYIGDHDMQVIGGGICEMTPALRTRYLDLARKSYHDHALDGFRDHYQIEYSICGDNASVLGALESAYE